MSNIFLDRSGLSTQIGFAMRQASVAVWNDLVTTLSAVGLKPQTYAALLIIETSPGCKQQDIADALGIARPNIVALIDGLVERTLIERTVNIGDRRSYALTLTAAGRALVQAGRKAHRAHELKLSGALAGDEETHIVAAAHKLSGCFEGT